jgi:hypothetical protein
MNPLASAQKRAAMRFTITPYDDHGAAAPGDVVDLPTLRERLARAAVTGQRLHISPRPRPAGPAAADEEHRP